MLLACLSEGRGEGVGRKCMKLAYTACEQLESESEMRGCIFLNSPAKKTSEKWDLFVVFYHPVSSSLECSENLRPHHKYGLIFGANCWKVLDLQMVAFQ